MAGPCLICSTWPLYAAGRWHASVYFATCQQLITAICAACSGLVSLSLTYSLRNIKMNYDRALFGMKLGDCKALARALEHSETLVRLQVRQMFCLALACC